MRKRDYHLDTVKILYGVVNTRMENIAKVIRNNLLVVEKNVEGSDLGLCFITRYSVKKQPIPCKSNAHSIETRK